MNKIKILKKLFNDIHNWNYSYNGSKYSIIHIPTKTCFKIGDGMLHFNGIDTSLYINNVKYQTNVVHLNLLEKIILYPKTKKITKYLKQKELENELNPLSIIQDYLNKNEQN